MKRLYYIATLAIALFASLPIQAQEEAGNTQQQQQRRRGPEASRGAREEEKKENGMPELTVRAQDMNERMTQHIGNARWMRVIYRQIDLTKEQNAPLYYPTQPMNGQMNLFSIIFQLVCEGKLSAYEYLDGYEDFSDNRKLDLKVMLDRCRIFLRRDARQRQRTCRFRRERKRYSFRRCPLLLHKGSVVFRPEQLRIRCQDIGDLSDSDNRGRYGTEHHADVLDSL